MFLNSWMLRTCYYLNSAKKGLQLHVSTVPFPIIHWLWINHKFIYNHVFLQRCKQVNFNCSSNSSNNHCSSHVGLHMADQTSVAFMLVAKTWLSGYSTHGSFQQKKVLHTPPTVHHVFNPFKPQFYTATQKESTPYVLLNMESSWRFPHLQPSKPVFLNLCETMAR